MFPLLYFVPLHTIMAKNTKSVLPTKNYICNSKVFEAYYKNENKKNLRTNSLTIVPQSLAMIVGHKCK